MTDVTPITPPKRKAEPSDRGRGVLLCYICKEPCAEHRIGPCPELADPSIRYSTRDRWSDRNYWRYGQQPPKREPKLKQVKPPPGFAPDKELEV